MMAHQSPRASEITGVQTQVRTQTQQAFAVPLGDEYFAMKATAGGIAEIAISRLAIERTTRPEIRAFAERMVKDHTDCHNKIIETARKKGIALPAALDAVSNGVLIRLGNMSGSDFDKAYLKAQMSRTSTRSGSSSMNLARARTRN